MIFSEKIKVFLPKKILIFAGYIKLFLRYIYFSCYRLIKKPRPDFLAVGESTEYFPSPYWTLVDLKESDINVDFEKTNYKFNSNLKNIYSSHCIEHLSDKAINYLFKEVFSNMQDNAVFRVETPDVEKIINDYKLKMHHDYLYEIQEENIKNLVQKRNMKNIYGELHIAMLGLISCYIDQIHIPVICSREKFEDKLLNLSVDEFCKWAISLQSKEELLTHGHINFWYFERLKKYLLNAGFSKVQRCDTGQSFYDFDLSLERFHRRNYSLIVEAVR
tara:strand:- start:1529 stop:2353 length:825 start_codon:yes stop_codon:yes gene_type:complete